MKQNLLRYLFSFFAVVFICGFSISCGGSDDDDHDLIDGGEKQTNIRLVSIDGQQLIYDDAGNMTSIKTSRWGNVMLNITTTLDGSYLSRFSEEGENFSVSWSNSNPSSMSGHGFKSVATYGESCNSAALCMAFNLYAMMYGDAYKTHILGVLYGYSLKGKFGKNANKLATHVEYHEADDDEYDDMICDYKFDKDQNGLVTLITMKIKTNSYKHGELKSSKEKTQTINLVWDIISNNDNSSNEEAKLPDTTPSGVTAVDLGLSVKWANCNVGASRPEEYGNYYAWGDINKKISEDCNPYNYRENICATDYDVAHVKWGGDWRMPSKADIDELCNKCNSVWTTQNGVYGMLITGPNKNTIFLPAAGCFSDKYYNSNNHQNYPTGVYSDGESGYYWSGSPSPDGSTQRSALVFSKKNPWISSALFSPIRSGASIRPVYGKLNK